MKKKQVVDLGLIRVERGGSGDKVFLTHNGLMAFSMRCALHKSSLVTFNKEFFSYSTEQWQAVFDAYLRWKRTQLPQFRLPNFSGRRADGAPHPWRRASKRIPSDSESDQEIDL